ncbi:DUF3899 domain-containing protein [Mycoplasmatota bacterium]|nr:DUF3899 domain-containing protein [Mycoplasmatota bacterium]
MSKRNLFIFLSLFILFISLVFTLKIEITLQKFVDSYFIISGLTSSLLLFKLLLDLGVFDTFRYSWHKTKKQVFFFVPKVWFKDDVNVGPIHTFDDFLNYKEKKKWRNLPILLFTSHVHLFIAMIFSLIIYYSQ